MRRISLGKRPSAYAAEILALPDRQARQEALNRVPTEHRETVRKMVEMGWKGRSRTHTEGDDPWLRTGPPWQQVCRGASDRRPATKREALMSWYTHAADAISWLHLFLAAVGLGCLLWLFGLSPGAATVASIASLFGLDRLAGWLARRERRL